MINTYGNDYKLIIVGNATMSPYQIVLPDGANERWNKEAGAVWLQSLLAKFPRAALINPQPEQWWPHHPSIDILHNLMAGRLYALTLEGLDRVMQGFRGSVGEVPL